MIVETEVLVVGGSLNGLTSAVALAHQGVRCMLVERHAATTVQYKFSGISPRSMEIYRGLGLQCEIRAHRTGDQKSGQVARARNLSDPDVQFWGNAWADTTGLSMASAETCDQDRLEPLLRAEAQRLGACLRFRTELVGFEDRSDGVLARIRHLDTGREQQVRARYLVAADGFASGVRQALGIERDGPGELQHWMNLIFHTDLQPTLQGKRLTSCFVTDVNGSIVPRDDRWLLAVQFLPEKGEKPGDFDQQRTQQLVRRAAGRDDVRVELFDARDWTLAAYVARAFRRGRVFLVGDAAHAIPPTGGFGGNTGIHDAHNLAWKLAFVLRGHAHAALLDSYEAERRRIAQRTLAQALARLSAWFRDPSKKLPPSEPVVDDLFVIFGQSYLEGAFIPEPDGGDAAFEDPRAPTGRPGTRAPHFEIQRHGVREGVHDLFGREFVLLTGDLGLPDLPSVAGKAPVNVLRVGRHAGDLAHGADLLDLDNAFPGRYATGSLGCALVRPDGVIAWRSREATTPDEVRATVDRLCAAAG